MLNHLYYAKIKIYIIYIMNKLLIRKLYQKMNFELNGQNLFNIKIYSKKIIKYKRLINLNNKISLIFKMILKLIWKGF